MSQTLNVLSIDFDYFQKVSRDILLNDYPAGCDLSTELSIYTWSGYYNNPKSAKELQKVEILEDELNHLKKLLLSEIKLVSENVNEYCFSEGKDFTRKRKLSFE